MEPTREEKQRYGADVLVLERDGDHTVYSFTGTGENVILTAYPVFPGIELVYHDIHASAMPARPCPDSMVAEIRHCREGRAEYTRGENSYFLAPGDLAVLRRDIAYVPQDSFLFSDTVENNIAFGVEEATHEQVVAAAEAA